MKHASKTTTSVLPSSSKNGRVQHKSTLTLRSPSVAIPVSPAENQQSAASRIEQNQSSSTTDSSAPEKVERRKYDVPGFYQTYARPKVVRELPTAALALDPHNNDHLPKLDAARFMNPATNPLKSHSYQRKVKTKHLSKYLQLYSPVTEEDAASTDNYAQVIW